MLNAVVAEILEDQRQEAPKSQNEKRVSIQARWPNERQGKKATNDSEHPESGKPPTAFSKTRSQQQDNIKPFKTKRSTSLHVTATLNGVVNKNKVQLLHSSVLRPCQQM